MVGDCDGDARGGREVHDGPNQAWKTMVATWELVPEERIVADVNRFVTALDAIIAAEGAYVSKFDLQNGHQMAMQRLVRGGALQEGGSRAATEELVQKGSNTVMETWDGITAKVRDSHQK